MRLISRTYNSCSTPLASPGSPAPTWPRPRPTWPRLASAPANLTVQMVAVLHRPTVQRPADHPAEKSAGRINLSIDQSVHRVISDQDNGNSTLLMDSFGYTPDPWSLLLHAARHRDRARESARRNGRELRPLQDPPVTRCSARSPARRTPPCEPGLLQIEHVFAHDLRSPGCGSRRTRSNSRSQRPGKTPTVSNHTVSPAVTASPRSAGSPRARPGDLSR